MSVGATEATWAITASLEERLEEIPAKHRPDHARAQLVALRLADRYRDARGYTDETVPQLCEALNLRDGAVRDALAALDKLGVWVVIRRGARGRGSRRAPGPLLQLRGTDPAEKAEELSGPDPAENDTELRGMNDELRGMNTVHRGPDPATPRRIPTVPPADPRVDEAVRILARERNWIRVGAARRSFASDGTLATLEGDAQRFPQATASDLVACLARSVRYRALVDEERKAAPHVS